MNKQSIWAVVAGAVVAIVATTLVDVVLHIAHVFPPINDPINDALALLATSYRILIGVAGAWLTARLAPDKPLKDRKSTRLNSSHPSISYAVFCLKKKKKHKNIDQPPS